MRKKREDGTMIKGVMREYSLSTASVFRLMAGQTQIMSEANARIIIDKLLRESDWVLAGDDGVVTVETEMQNQSGFADYVLKNSSDFPLCIIEAKKELISPLVGKEQARGYAESLN